MEAAVEGTVGEPVEEPPEDRLEVLTEMRLRREALGPEWTQQRLADEVKALLPADHALAVETIREWELRRHLLQLVVRRRGRLSVGARSVAS